MAWHPIQIETRSLFETSWLRTGKRWAPQPFPTHYFYQNGGGGAAFRANHCFKKVTFSLCKKSCFDKCNCSNQTVKKISAEERSVSFELQRANLESTSKRIAFCKTRLLQEKPARASFSYMNGLKNDLPQHLIFAPKNSWLYSNFHAKNEIEKKEKKKIVKMILNAKFSTSVDILFNIHQLVILSCISRCCYVLLTCNHLLSRLS